MDRLIADGPRIQHWMHARSGLPIKNAFHGIAREVNGQIVAAFGYDDFQDWSCQMHTCVDVPWGYNRILLSRAFAVPFVQWNYRCLFAFVQVGNTKSLNLAKRMGFHEFALVPEAHPGGGIWFGKMTPDQCRWLQLAEKLNERRR